MDHLFLTQVDAHMADTPAGLAEKKQIPGPQFGKIHGAGGQCPHPGLGGAGTGQVDMEVLVDVLHKSGSIGAFPGLQGAPSPVGGI